MGIVAGIAVLLLAGGYAVDKIGEGTNDAANAAIKLAVVGGVAAIVYYKVIKRG